jgi:hypothetical protein
MREEVTGDCINLYNKDLHKLYSLPDIIKIIKSRWVRWVGHVVCMGEMRNAYDILVRKLDRNRVFGTPDHGWEDNIKVDLKEIV